MQEDDSLKNLLQDWIVSPAPHPAFRREVWARLSAGSRRSHFHALESIRQWLLVSVPKPVYACGLVVLFAVGGIAAADLHAARITQRQSEHMAQRYLTSIDPLAMADNALNPRP